MTEVEGSILVEYHLVTMVHMLYSWNSQQLAPEERPDSLQRPVWMERIGIPIDIVIFEPPNSGNLQILNNGQALQKLACFLEVDN